MRVLLYGEIDLNLIDGSAIWLASVAEVMASRPDVEVLLLQRTPLTRRVVVDGLARLPNVRLLDPWQPDHWGGTAAVPRPRGPRLDAAEAAALMAAAGARWPLDALLVRGLDAAERASATPGAAPRLWVYVTDPRQYVGGAARDRLRALFGRAAGLLCQTPEARAVLADTMGPQSDERIVLLPPMIPAVSARARHAPGRSAPKLGYSGKLSPPYLLLETLDAFARIRDLAPGAEFHVVGDKIHNVPRVVGFETTLAHRLRSSPGVVWHGGVTREAAAAILDRVDVAASWRAASLDDSLEMSTKVLEYAALGIPALMNPSPVQRRVFGPEYPGYVTTAGEFVAAFERLTSSAPLYAQASAMVRAVAGGFTFRSALAGLEPVLQARPPARGRQSTRVLVAGHDLKFLRPVVERLERQAGYEVLIDTYQGHAITDEARSAALLERADLVFCEWCLGNAAWYSRRVRDDQRLVVRLHLQERDLPYLDRVDWRRVDRLVFIAPWVMEYCLAARPWLRPRASVIYNPIVVDEFDRPKLQDAAFNLGMIGINPCRKAPHVALDIFERLRAIDSRYTLFIKSQPPWELPWLWRQGSERRYYEAFFDRVRTSPHANAVVFDPPGPDVPAWLSTIGFVLSTSDFEGSHQAVAEGMASGAVPIVRRWAGADQLYPHRYVVDTDEQAADLVRQIHLSSLEADEAACRRYARELFDADLIARRYLALFDEVLASPRVADAGPVAPGETA